MHFLSNGHFALERVVTAQGLMAFLPNGQPQRRLRHVSAPCYFSVEFVSQAQFGRYGQASGVQAQGGLPSDSVLLQSMITHKYVRASGNTADANGEGR